MRCRCPGGLNHQRLAVSGGRWIAVNMDSSSSTREWTECSSHSRAPVACSAGGHVAGLCASLGLGVRTMGPAVTRPGRTHRRRSTQRTFPRIAGVCPSASRPRPQLAHPRSSQPPSPASTSSRARTRYLLTHPPVPFLLRTRDEREASSLGCLTARFTWALIAMRESEEGENKFTTARPTPTIQPTRPQ